MLAFGLMVSLTLAFTVFRMEQRSEQAEFARRAQFRVAAVQGGVTNAIEALQVVNQSFKTFAPVSREQFHAFTQPLHERHPYIEAFSFHRLILRQERPAFEAHMRDRQPGFTIADMVDGKREVAAVRERYSVIDYVEPMAGRESQIGLDTLPQPFQVDAIQRASDTGLPSATSLLRLIKDNSEAQRSFRIVMAVYREGAVPDDVTSRRMAVAGHTVVVLRAGDFFERIFASAGPSDHAGLDIRVYADASAQDSQLVYPLAGAATGRPERWWPAWMTGSGPEPFIHSFDIAGTAWHMVIAAQSTPFATRYVGALLVLLLGCLATYATIAYLKSIALRAQRTEQLVVQRTAELTERTRELTYRTGQLTQRTEELDRVNDLLTDDINARKQVEQALKSSEARARELAELSSDWSWEQDEHFRFTSPSIEATEKNGPPPRANFGMTRWELPVDLDASDWLAHRAMLEAHQPFRNFEFKRLIDGMPARWLSVSGKPLFDADGRFKGYRGTGRNITDRKEAEEALLHSRAALRELAEHQESVREDERKRIARDIHDELGQNLLVLHLDVLRIGGHLDLSTQIKESFDVAVNQIEATIKAVRTIINDLRPGVLDLGLHAAVEWQAREFERSSGIVCELHVDHDEFALDDRRATALFRIVQESLSNVLRHAKANHVQIGMQRRDDRLFMEIVDDGIGISPSSRTKAGAFGLVGMEERIRMLGGTFDIASTPGAGLTIRLSVPI